MRITILSPDISSNAMARTCPIAKVLSRTNEVEILGFDSGDGFFDPYSSEFEYRAVETDGTPWGLWSKMNKLEEFITGHVCYAFRPMVGSLGVALLHKRRTGTPVVLDVEDLIRFEEYPLYRKLYNSIAFSGSPTAGIYAEMLERLLANVDQTTVTSTNLQERYGGKILPYGPDEDVFDPNQVKPNSNLHVEHPIIPFIGTVRPHKGLDTLARAIANMEIETRLVIAGYDPNGQIPKLEQLSGGRVDFIGPIEHDQVPSYIAAGSVIVIPQKATRYTQAQIPNKVFEAMSMAKPIIASNVSDLPQILNSCGCIVPPEDPEALAEAIDELLSNPKRAKKLGYRARERYIQQYGWDSLEEKLGSVFCEFTNGS